MKEYVADLKIGFLQTVVESKVAWGFDGHYSEYMSQESEEKAWYEIKKGVTDLLNDFEKPDIIVLPELSIPLGYLYEITRLAASTGTVIIGGLDFIHTTTTLVNKGVVIVPQNWPTKLNSKSCSTIYFGKTFYSWYEEIMFPSKKLISQSEILLLDAANYGNIGLAICSDFFDIERFVIYKGRIHHMIIICHNQDTESFYFLAEAVSRLVFCNVVICNTGEFGDSVAFSPYKDTFKRTIYRHKGQNLFSTQVVSLPVKSLDNAQSSNTKTEFKSKPPGYIKYS